MKNITFLFITICLIMPLSCTSSGTSASSVDSNFHTFNQALDIGMKKIESDLPQGADVTILDFKSISPNLSYYIIEEMYDKLINGKKLSILDRSRTDTIKKEVGYQLSGNVDDNQIISIGKQAGANYVVTGEITFSGEAYRLRVFAIDIEKNQRVASSSLNINSDDKQVNYLISVKNEDDILKGYVTLETEKQPAIGNVSAATGGFKLSVLSSCLVEVPGESVTLPAGGIKTVNNLSPGLHNIILLYDDYTIQDIFFTVSPGEIKNLNLGYISGGFVPNFPPVSTTRAVNINGTPEWLSMMPPDDYLWGIGISDDRHTAEKNAYVEIARQYSTSFTSRRDEDKNGNLTWEDSISKTNPETISRVASAAKINKVSYDSNKKTYWVLAELSKSDAQKIVGGKR